MISITVHHHSQLGSPASPLAGLTNCQTPSKSSTSNFHVQYRTSTKQLDEPLPAKSESRQRPRAALDANNNEIGAENCAAQRQQANRLHSRSISLIINPEFSSDSDGFEPSALRRRRSLPRRSRLKFTKPEEPTGSDRPSEDSSSEEPAKELPAASERDQNENNQAKSSPDILEHFRQTGAILRQISDEFSKSRRRTI